MSTTSSASSLKEPEFPVTVTGSMAVKEWATDAPAKAAYVYVSSIQEASEQWGLRPNAAAPNVILLEPKTVGDVPFTNTIRSKEGYPWPLRRRWLRTC